MGHQTEIAVYGREKSQTFGYSNFVGNCHVTGPNGAVASHLSTDIRWRPNGLPILFESAFKL